jgi:hypothetical protein
VWETLTTIYISGRAGNQAMTRHLVTPCSQVTCGIIRYAAASGLRPDDDAADFDGWYSDREDALAVASDWATRFPDWVVALVRSDQFWFSGGDFTTVAHRPLTWREAGFAAGERGGRHQRYIPW